ncbi:MAG: hypothetical protein V5A55_12200 [Halovenus sp.]
MRVSHDVSALPTFTALDGHAVLDGTRRGASIQLDGTYFAGQLRALETFEGALDAVSNADRERRAVTLRTSRDRYDRIDVDVDSLTEPDLRTASDRFRRQLQRLQEVEYLERGFPGRCFVVPEWLRLEDRLQYGARVYFFRNGDSPAPEDIVRKNIEAVVDGASETFERYQGRLHGYPDCCIDFYYDRAPDTPPPEWRSVEPFADRIEDAALGDGVSTSIDDVLPRVSDWEDGYAFFAREFFPEPECDTALSDGRTIHERLSASVPDRLVDDYFRLTFGYDYLVARSVRTGGSHRPTPGALGREHLLFYLPLRDVLTVPRYR